MKLSEKKQGSVVVQIRERKPGEKVQMHYKTITLKKTTAKEVHQVILKALKEHCKQ